MPESIRVLIIGDISGSSGMGAVFRYLRNLIKTKKIDFVIANGENAAAGFGIERGDYIRMKQMGIDVVTSGNHIWQKQEIYEVLDSSDDLLRPINYPSGCPGRGFTVRKKGNHEYAVINAQGRYSMKPIDDPFKRIEDALKEIGNRTKLIFVDFHAEEEFEKEAIAFCFDGKVTSVTGTHTHVQTADEKILPGGTAYITDVGMTGYLGGVIGSDPAGTIKRQKTGIPVRTEPVEDEGHIQGVIVEADPETGKAISIERVTC